MPCKDGSKDVSDDKVNSEKKKLKNLETGAAGVKFPSFSFSLILGYCVFWELL